VEQADHTKCRTDQTWNITKFSGKVGQGRKEWRERVTETQIFKSFLEFKMEPTRERKNGKGSWRVNHYMDTYFFKRTIVNTPRLCQRAGPCFREEARGEIMPLNRETAGSGTCPGGNFELERKKNQTQRKVNCTREIGVCFVWRRSDRRGVEVRGMQREVYPREQSSASG